MKNSYGSRLRKNNKIREKNIEERLKNVYPLSHYINNGKRLNITSGYNKIEVKKRGIHYINQNSNLLLNSYNQSSDYLKNNLNNKNFYNPNCKTEYNTINRINNHSLFDSNKQKIIKPENNNHNYVRFISKNKNEIEKEYYYDKHNKQYKYSYRGSNINKYPLCTIRSFHKSHEYMEKFGEFDKLKIGDNKINGRVNYIIRNNTYEKRDTIGENSLSRNKINHNITYCNYINNKDNNTINYKRSNHTKNHPSLQNNRNINYQNNNININRNNIYSQSQSKDKYENLNRIRNINYIKKNYTDNNYLTENSVEKDLNRKGNIFIINRDDDIKMKSIESFSPNKKVINSPEYMKYNSKRTKEYNKNINKTNNSNTSKLLKELMLPIKLNIKDKNKEKLSRIKRIIEKSSTNQNFYQIDLHKYFKNKIIKSNDEKNKKITEKPKKPIFKKKHIKNYTKEENKDEGIFFKNNFLVTSPINQTKKYKPNILLNNKIKDNNQIQSLVASYNLFTEKDKKDENEKKNTNKLSSKETENTSHLNKTFKKKKVYQKKKNININNINIEDTISLSYSKEQNLSFNSKKENNNMEENSISFPFFIENFNIFYNKKNKVLIINGNEKDNDNKYLKNNDNDSDDDYYQLTKEILLLKKGLAKKSELSKEIKRKLKNIRPQRIYQLSLIGSKGIYKKKRYNYKQNNPI